MFAKYRSIYAQDRTDISSYAARGSHSSDPASSPSNRLPTAESAAIRIEGATPPMRKFTFILAVVLVGSTIGISMVAETASFGPAMPARMTEISGTIRDIHGRPVAALKISLRNWFGTDLASAVTNRKGMFDLREVIPGRYHINFRPLAENSTGQTMIIDVPAHKMRMNLTLTRNPPAIARARRHTPAIA
jgi:Carboxypeptidase regulatory-like domain